ncbi:MAG: hypothetical protein ACXWO3_19830, partial [Isosphaeraceae bacterium]
QGQCAGPNNPWISGREEVGIAGRSQDGEDAQLPQGSGGCFYRHFHPARRETPGFFFFATRIDKERLKPRNAPPLPTPWGARWRGFRGLKPRN